MVLRDISWPTLRGAPWQIAVSLSRGHDQETIQVSQTASKEEVIDMSLLVMAAEGDTKGLLEHTACFQFLLARSLCHAS